MKKRSAGLLMYRMQDGRALEVFLVHPGGPFYVKKDLGTWSIPKGEVGTDEDALAAAAREFHEETGKRAAGRFFPLGEVKQSGGKVVTAWAFAGEFEAAALRSSTCLIEWPPRSGRQIEIPEVDRGAWFTVAEARAKMVSGQVPLLDRLVQVLDADLPEVERRRATGVPTVGSLDELSD